ncbi:hypothetical protein [Streptomyces sp. NPDC050564]|uniref:hypothetical protein n=1 Tax=Streptomyces sp. NPDC050564 TaxID=3365631 RepID=UPI003789E484
MVGAVLLTALAGGLAELTRTRDEHENDDEATSVPVRIDMRGKDMTDRRRVLAARQLWEGCRDSTSVPLDRAKLGSHLAVGPPSIEQIHYGPSLGPGRAEQPPLPAVAVSGLVDAPTHVVLVLTGQALRPTAPYPGTTPSSCPGTGSPSSGCH